MIYSPWTHCHYNAIVSSMSIPEHRRQFGLRVRELRIQCGWASQEAFAHHIDLDRTYISGIERGRRNPTLDVIVRIADGLRVPPAELLTTLGS